MLNVEIRFMIKDLYRTGLSVSEIARLTGHDRKTIRAIIHGPLNPTPSARKPKASKLDPFVPYLEKRIAEGVLNAAKLLTEIKAQGYPGGKSLVKGFVQPFREARQPQATVRFETEPGEQAQVDWGHFGFIEHAERRRRLYAFVMTLGWSRAMYVEFTVSADAAWWLRCHLHAFQYFGGVPQEVLHDNLKTAVLDRSAEGMIHWNPRYLDFAAYYGFRPRACQPYRAQTKGKVESGIKYVRGNFWLGLRFIDLPDLNRQVRAWLDLTANMRVHGTTGEIPFERLALEHLQSLSGKPSYDTSVLTFRRSTKDCFVSYAGNYYSVPSAYARKALQLKETEDGQLLILNAQAELLTQHALLPGRNRRQAVPAHYADIRPIRRPIQRTPALQIRLADLVREPLDAPQVEVRPLSWYDQAVEVAR